MQPSAAPAMLFLRLVATSFMGMMTGAMMTMPTAAGVNITFRNLCDSEMTLSDGAALSEAIAQNDFAMQTLHTGDIRAYRYGKGNQATLAEFSISDGQTWYDIGIIPVGPTRGPEHCSSLEDCKAFTGGLGFNVAMKIIPHKGDELVGDHCRTLHCLEDGCPDAYHFPADDKTHNCPDNLHFTVVFCATETTGSSESSLGGWEDASALEESGSTLESQSSSTPSPEPTRTASTRSASEGSGAGTAVYVASILGGAVVMIAALVVYRRFRYHSLERINERKLDSDAIMFVEARDQVKL